MAAQKETDLLSGGGPPDAFAESPLYPDDAPEPEELRHALIAFYLVLFVMFGAQAGLVSWRKKHRRSYDLATLVGLWLIPPMISVQLGFWRFVFSWLLYSSVTGWYLYRCSSKQLDKTVPKQVYAYFMIVFRVSVAVGFIGYIMLILEFTGLGALFRSLLGPGASLTALWYGLYYGILTRDSAEVATDRIARSLGAGRKLAVSVRSCGICGGNLNDSIGTPSGGAAGGAGGGSGLGTIQLSCKHLFHMECIRGWCIIGKKDTCPTCWEKVDLRSVFADKPWDTTNLSWIQMLDMVRYLVVWNPVIFLALHFIFHAFGLDQPAPHHHHGQYANGTAILNGTAGVLNGTAALAANATVAAVNATAAAVNATVEAVAQALR
ncbi:RING finger protein 121 [Chlorella vulgaris]